MSIAAGTAVFFACFLLFAANVMGGGDVKLLTASAVWFGFDPSLVTFLMWVSIMGGVVTAGILLLRLISKKITASGIPLPASILDGQKVPYAIAIALAGLLTYSNAPLVKAALQNIS